MRNLVGNPLYREDSQEPTHSEVYWYDDANRLTEFKRGDLEDDYSDVKTYTTDANLTQRNAWTLDALGNWDEFIKRTNNTTITEPRTNNKANEYATIDPDGSGGASPITLAHDHNGNLTFDGNWTYDYDIENRMTRVRKGTDIYAEYHYDALGRRIRKVIPSGRPDEGTWTYVVNELWQVVSEYHTVSSTTTHIRRYVHAGQSAYVDDHVAMWDMTGPKFYYYHADAQFCTVAMTDDTGAVNEYYVTDPYGKAVTYNGSWGSPQATSRIGNPFMHQGLWLDGECGKYQNRNREFLPTLGRFAQRDLPQYSNGRVNYAALELSPLKYLDPDGRISILGAIIRQLGVKPQPPPPFLPPQQPQPPPPNYGDNFVFCLNNLANCLGNANSARGGCMAGVGPFCGLHCALNFPDDPGCVAGCIIVEADKCDKKYNTDKQTCHVGYNDCLKGGVVME